MASPRTVDAGTGTTDPGNATTNKPGAGLQAQSSTLAPTSQEAVGDEGNQTAEPSDPGSFTDRVANSSIATGGGSDGARTPVALPASATNSSASTSGGSSGGGAVVAVVLVLALIAVAVVVVLWVRSKAQAKVSPYRTHCPFGAYCINACLWLCVYIAHTKSCDAHSTRLVCGHRQHCRALTRVTPCVRSPGRAKPSTRLMHQWTTARLACRMHVARQRHLPQPQASVSD